MTRETLEALSDGELQSVITQCNELLKRRDDDRKAKALSTARALLAGVGLSLKDVAAKGRIRNGKAPAYHVGHQYRHPSNTALVWNGKGQKPAWLRELESVGGKAVELAPEAANDNTAKTAPVRRAG